MECKLIQVGKKGLTPEVLGEVKAMLRKHRKVRVKFLKSARGGSSRDDLAEEVLRKVKAGKSELRGNILTLSL